MKIQIDRRKYSWAIMALAATVTVIHIVFMYLYGVEVYDSTHYAWYNISDGILDCVLVYMMISAWRVRKANFPNAILLGTVSMLAFYMTFFHYLYSIIEYWLGILGLISPYLIWSVLYKVRQKAEKRKAIEICCVIWGITVLAIVFFAAAFGYELKWLHDFVIPIILIILEGCACTWTSAREYKNEEERKKWLWCAWVGSIAFAILLTGQFSNELSLFWTMSCWGRVLEAAMPILYALIFRWLMRRKMSSALKLFLYYAFCMCTVWQFGFGVFGLIIPILVCVYELRQEEHNGRVTVGFSALYAIAWAIYSFFSDKRLREIIYNLGGPAVNIDLTERVNWVGYKMAALRSYLIGNEYAFYEYYLRNGLTDSNKAPLEQYPGYSAFIDGDSLGSLTYRFGYGWLIVMAVLVVAVAILLLIGRIAKGQSMRRNMLYMGIGYLIRVVVSCVYIVTMTVYSGAIFPFNASVLMDLLVLGMILYRNLEPQEGDVPA